MDLQKRAQEAALSELVDNMSPTAIFNRFDRCLLELSVVALLVLRIFVSVLASENFLSIL
jgi:hypothetical protein